MQCIECFPVRRCVHLGNALFCYYEQHCTIRPCPTKIDIPIIHDPGPLGPVVMSYSSRPSCFRRCMQITGGNLDLCQSTCGPHYT